MAAKTLAELDAAGAADPVRMWHDDCTEARVTYAWNWFQYHASQRLQAFNFFLLIVAALIGGYLTALDREYPLMQIAIGLAGLIISYAFVALDFRNAQLVDDARLALVNLECALGLKIHRSDYPPRVIAIAQSQILFGIDWPTGLSRVPLLGKPFARPVEMRHTFWLRRIERFVLLFSIIGIAVGVVGVLQDNGLTYGHVFAAEKLGATVVTTWPKK